MVPRGPLPRGSTRQGGYRSHAAAHTVERPDLSIALGAGETRLSHPGARVAFYATRATVPDDVNPARNREGADLRYQCRSAQKRWPFLERRFSSAL